jgi:F-type H+-transporting ATPase subunit epsilon
MSSSAAASAYWRVAGMSYLKYSGLCSDMVRAALVPELRAKARTREVVYYREAIWKEGKPEKQTIVDIVPEEAQEALKK